MARNASDCPDVPRVFDNRCLPMSPQSFTLWLDAPMQAWNYNDLVDTG